MNKIYLYRQNLLSLVICCVFFIGGSLVLGISANRNDRGAIVQGIIRLNESQATAFYWVLSILCFIMGFLGMCAGVYNRFFIHQRLIFKPTLMILPRSRWSRQTISIFYIDIVAVSLSKRFSMQLLNIIHQGGEYTIVSSMLPSKRDFCAVSDFLMELTIDVDVIE